VCTFLAVDGLQKDGWRTRRSITIISAVSVGNFVGTLIGVTIAAAILHHH
jgi:hypothetical protein